MTLLTRVEGLVFIWNNIERDKGETLTKPEMANLALVYIVSVIKGEIPEHFERGPNFEEEDLN